MGNRGNRTMYQYYGNEEGVTNIDYYEGLSENIGQEEAIGGDQILSQKLGSKNGGNLYAPDP